MRFYQKDNILLPTKSNFSHSFRISNASQNQLITPPLNKAYPFNPQLQASLQGKTLLLAELPFSEQEIQAHYENGYCSYRKGIEKKLAISTFACVVEMKIRSYLLLFLVHDVKKTALIVEIAS